MKIPAVLLATRHDVSKYPSIQKHNARVAFCILIIIIPGFVLPFILPNSSWLEETYIFKTLGSLIPAANKLAAPAIHKNVVFVYVNFMLSLAFLLSAWTAFKVDSWREFSIGEVNFNRKKHKVLLWLKAVFGVVFFMGLLAFFYIFPGKVDGGPGNTRGTLIVSLMVMTKPGLAIFGAIASVGVYVTWVVLYCAFSNIFFIPFANRSNNSKEQS